MCRAGFAIAVCVLINTSACAWFLLRWLLMRRVNSWHPTPWHPQGVPLHFTACRPRGRNVVATLVVARLMVARGLGARPIRQVRRGQTDERVAGREEHFGCAPG